MSDTPETDAFQQTDQCAYDSMWRGFARKLERERDDLREIFPKILEALESGACASTCSVDFLREIPREVRLVRQRLERERDEARFGLAYRLEQYAIKQLQLSDARKTILELQKK